MRSLVQVEPSALIFAAALLLLVPLRWLLASVAAALLHEICHILALRLMGGQIYSIRVGITGASIEMTPLPAGAELFCSLAGPVGSLSLLAFRRVFPILAVCGFVQGLFNLLPVYPLDGGRALKCMISIFLPDRSDKVICVAERIAGCAAVALLCCVTVSFGRFRDALVFGLLVVPSVLLRKIPCKRRRIKVQ